VHARATRLVSRALANPSSGQLVVADDLMEAVAHIAHECTAMARRADGEPILRARLRLGLPAPTSPDHLFDTSVHDVNDNDNDNGNGNSNSNGSGNGNSNGSGNSSGNGSGNSNGNGSGNGNGNGDGERECENRGKGGVSDYISDDKTRM
jgi:hypothetical protein